jgi:hypothetical protein
MESDIARGQGSNSVVRGDETRRQVDISRRQTNADSQKGDVATAPTRFTLVRSDFALRQGDKPLCQ